MVIDRLVYSMGDILRAVEEKIIYIDIIGEAEFDVLYDRATSNATGAVIAGLIGAGIQSGIEASNDAKKTNELEHLVDNFIEEVVYDEELAEALKEYRGQENN